MSVPAPAASSSASSASAASSASSSASSAAPAASSLTFASPDDMDVRQQLFGILLCDQLEAANSVPRTKDSRKRKTSQVPAAAARCFQEGCVAKDPLLRLALFSDKETDARIVRHSHAVCAFVRRVNPALPAYIRDAYTALADTTDHLLQLASVFFFVYWFTDCDEDSQVCTLRVPADPQARALLKALNFRAHPGALSRVHAACRDYEYGKTGMHTMLSFVHSMVGNHWKAMAPVPRARKRPRHQRKFATTASQSSSSSSELGASDASESSESPDATHSGSASSSEPPKMTSSSSSESSSEL